MVLYNSPAGAEENMKVTPEQTKIVMDAWMAWSTKCGSALVDMGSPLGMGEKYTNAGSSKSESKVSGYSFLQAESMDSVKELLEGHPHLMMKGAEIEVHEVLPM